VLEAEVGALLPDTVAQPRGGLFGEGEGQDLSRGYALVEEPEYFFGYDPGFAGTRAGEDELEAAGGNGFFLGGVEGHSGSRLVGWRKKMGEYCLTYGYEGREEFLNSSSLHESLC